jgi:8-oxo-dGTP diphosphatase
MEYEDLSLKPKSKMNLQYNAPNISITIDCVIFGFDGKTLQILLIKRASDPLKGKWALPGGFMEKNETAEAAAERVLENLTGVSNIYMDQVRAFSALDRHPLERVITIAFYALVKPENYKLNPAWHASDATWSNIDKFPELGFDHRDIIMCALKALKRDVRLRPIGFELLPEKFTLKELQNLYEAILEKKLDRRNFRRKMKSTNIVQELNEVRKGAHKDANLFQFDKQSYDEMLEEGFNILFY